MPSEVIYARIPAGLKLRVGEYAEKKALTTTTAVVDLLDHGLESAAKATYITKLEKRVTELETELSTTLGKLRDADAKATSAGEKQRGLTAAYQGLAQRTQQVVGSCPYCQQPIRGYDLFVTGQCAKCAKTISTLLVSPQPKGGLDQKEVLILLGALGIILGMAYIQSK